MRTQATVAVIGAGIVGAATALALATRGRSVLLVDRAEPGETGASYGNAGHIASELIAPLPSPRLLAGFWRELCCFGGALDIPLSRVPALVPWFARFASAAFRRGVNTQSLAPLVRPATSTFERWLTGIGRRDLLRLNGHYEIWMGGGAERKSAAQLAAMRTLDVPVEVAPGALLERIRQDAGVSSAAGVWFPGTGHVVDPLEVVRAFAAAAIGRGTEFLRADVRALRPSAAGVELVTDMGVLPVGAAVVCAGVDSARLLRPLGLSVPLEGVRGYHVELPGGAGVVDAPVLYCDDHIVVSPLVGRLRASGFMEFRRSDAGMDLVKLGRLRECLRGLGYGCLGLGGEWVGSRPVLPDYLPGLGRVGGSSVFYSVGLQHIGLTLAPVVAELVGDLVVGRELTLCIEPFDLCRFGGGRGTA